MEQVILDHYPTKEKDDPFFFGSRPKESVNLISLFGKYPNFIMTDIPGIISNFSEYIEDEEDDDETYSTYINGKIVGIFLRIPYDIRYHIITELYDESGRRREVRYYEDGTYNLLRILEFDEDEKLIGDRKIP